MNVIVNTKMMKDLMKVFVIYTASISQEIILYIVMRCYTLMMILMLMKGFMIAKSFIFV